MASTAFVQSVLTLGTTLKCVKSETSAQSHSSNEDQCIRKKRKKIKEIVNKESSTSTNAVVDMDANGKVRVIKTRRTEPVKKFKQTTLYGEIAIASDDDGAFDSDELTDCDDDGISLDSNDDDFDFELVPKKDRKTAPTRHEIMARRRVIWFRQKKFLGDSSASSSQESATAVNADSSIEIIEAETVDSGCTSGSQISVSGEQSSRSSLEMHGASSNESTSTKLNKRRKFRRNHSIKKYLVVKTDSSVDSIDGLVQESQLMVKSTHNSVLHLSDSEVDNEESSGTRHEGGPTKQPCIVLDSSTDNIEEVNESA